MNTKLLTIICCPFDQGQLRVKNAQSSKNERIENGTLLCQDCGCSFPIHDGIPDFTGEEKKSEAQWRDEIYSTMHGDSYRTLIPHIVKHHYVATMSHEARTFARRFSSGNYILDLGSGWCWPWHGVIAPDIVCIDFSMKALLYAKTMLTNQIDANIHLLTADFTRLPIQSNSLAGVWSSRAIYVRNDNVEKVNNLILTVKNKLHQHNGFFVFDNYPYLIAGLFKLFGKHVSKIIDFGDFAAKRIQKSDLPEALQTFRGVHRMRYNEILYNHELKLIHNVNVACIDILIGRLPWIGPGLARQIIFESYE